MRKLLVLFVAICVIMTMIWINENEMTWEDGDELTITVTGTGEYEGWSGRETVTAYTDVIYIHVDDIILQRN